MNFPIAVLATVFVAIAFRQVGRLRLRIWQAMGAGALAVLLNGDISPIDALRAVDLDVMLFLFGMFVVGEALVESGYLYTVAYHAFAGTRSTDTLVLAVLFGAGLASALLMNDTLAIVGTPLMLRLAREHRLDARLLLLTLAIAVTTGSVMSPIGNPQNLLIAIGGGIANPFVTFLAHLFVPTVLGLLGAYGVLRLAFRESFHGSPLVHERAGPGDPALTRLARLSLGLIGLMVLAKVALVWVGAPWELRLSWIALAGALPILVASPRRVHFLRRLDWPTLLFFAAMFVLTACVWQTGFLQQSIQRLGLDLTQPGSILGVGVLLSQLISNVPLVALYLPLLQHAGVSEAGLLTLAAGSTVAGNLLILGAASNVIIVESADRRGVHLSFLQFARVGIPVTGLHVAIYWLFLSRWV
jgi:Na+/H+ antiporter NhaD/arsenite permease-like protein